MEVIIDGQRYGPILSVKSDNNLLLALESRLHPDSDCGDITIRAFLHKLLATLWEEQEEFSGKRPFGNSGWDFELHYPLVKGGFIKGSLNQNEDEYGYYPEDCDTQEAWEYIRKLIDVVFFGFEEK